MTWSKFDDAAPKSPKAVAAGNEAWALWAAAIMYCNRHLTDGYVTLAALATDCLPRPIPIARAKKLAEELCAAVQRPDGKGLFEAAQNGMYLVHDFLDWNPSKVEVEAKRKKDRDRKRGGFQLDSEQVPSGNPDGIPGGIQGGTRTDSEAPRTRVRALPSRPVPTRPDPERERARAPEPTKPVPTAPRLDAFSRSLVGPNEDELWVFARWAELFGKTGAVFDARRATCLAERRLAGMTREDAENALQGALADDYVMGRKTGERNDRLSLIFGDQERYEGFRDKGRELARKARGGSPTTVRKARAEVDDLPGVPFPDDLRAELGITREITSGADAVAAILDSLANAQGAGK
jgi:hypothetical protein